MAKGYASSYSKLKNFEQCAFRYLKIDVQRIPEFKEKSEQLDWGNKVHKAMELALLGTAPLPAEMKPWQKWVDMVQRLPGELLVEQKWALTRDLQACTYFAPAVWWRARIDVFKIDHANKRATMPDWKTGRTKHDFTQLVLNAACAFAHHPYLETIRAAFIWLPEDEITHEDFTKETVAEALKNGILDRINAVEQAHIMDSFPPNPGGLCREFCPVSICQYWRKGSPR